HRADRPCLRGRRVRRPGRVPFRPLRRPLRGDPIMRAEPVIAMGLGSMLIQGVLFALLFPAFQRGGDSVWDGVRFSWALGGFLASYIVLGEAGKYAIPSIASWIAVEGSVAFVQYTLFGVLLGLIHRRRAEAIGAHSL